MKSHASSCLLLILVVLTELTVGNARKIGRVRGHEKINESSLHQKTLSESQSRKRNENNTPVKSNRRLDDHPPCTYYYSTKKSKFNKYDDDWYNPCKTVESEDSTVSPSSEPSLQLPESRKDSTMSPSSEPSRQIPETRSPSGFFSTTTTTQTPLITSNNGNQPPLEMVTEHRVSTSQIPSAEPTMSYSTEFTLTSSYFDSTLSPSKAPAVLEETSAEIDINLNTNVKEKEPSCLQVKSGRVVKTPVNLTIHFEYELLAERDSNMTGVVWPEIDRAFQRFLALMLIDCDMDVKGHGASNRLKSKLKSISPEPIDSVGLSYPNGWSANTTTDRNATSCTNIVISDELLTERGLYCDVVTGSITLYLNPVSYSDAASNPSNLYRDYREKIIQILRAEINEGGESISNYLDDDLGIRGFYLISETTNSNLRPITTVPEVISNKSKASEKAKEMTSSITTIVGSLIAFVAFTLAGGAFVIHRRNKDLDELDRNLKQVQTPQMGDSEIEFFDIDLNDDQDNGDATVERMFSHQKNKINDEHETDYHISRTNFDGYYGRPDPSIEGVNSHQGKYTLDPDMNDVQFPYDESSNSNNKSINSQSSSVDLESCPELTDCSTPETPSSYGTDPGNIRLKGSPALEYILSLGSSVISSPSKSYTEVSNTEDENDVESPLQGSIRSRILQNARISPMEGKNLLGDIAPDFSDLTNHPPKSSNNFIWKKSKSPWKKSNSPNSVINLATSSEIDDDEPIKSHIETFSSPNAHGDRSRKEYLKNRRKELENRFQNYRRSISERVNSASESPSKSWLASREFSRSVSVYKNSDESFLSPGITLSNAGLTERIPGSGFVTKLYQGIVSKASIATESDQSSKRCLQTPVVRKQHTSLAGIAEDGENEHLLGIESPPSKDNENELVDVSL